MFDFLKKKSIYFITFHKAASSLFGHEVLSGFKGLYHYDPEERIYDCNYYVPNDLEFKRFGFVYGPIRMSSSRTNKNNLKLFDIVENNAPSSRAIFLTRDPRDILVSSYYSFINSHNKSNNLDHLRSQEESLKKISKQTIDEYATAESAEGLLYAFQEMLRLHLLFKNKLILRYEDLVDHPKKFIKSLNDFEHLDTGFIETLYNNSRPLNIVDIKSHKRSGIPGQYKYELQPQSINKLNNMFYDILQKLNYEL
jgi:hypothetical protein